MEIGFIGLDNIGFPMAKRLASKFSVVAFDVHPEFVGMFAEIGGKTAPSVLEIGKRCETIFSSVPSSEMLEAVTIGNDGIVTSKRVTRFVNLTTIGSKLTKRLADHLLKANITYIDSPVSGTPKQAENGSLIVMTACADDDFKLVEPLLKELGQVFHVGQSAGLAQTMSLVRAMVSVSELLINSEATTMSAQSDLDRSLMLALGNHPNDSDNIQKLAASMLTKKLNSDLTPAMIYKDLRLLKEEMETLGMNPSLAHAVGELWQGASAKMGPDSPITSLMKLVECWSDVSLSGKGKKM